MTAAARKARLHGTREAARLHRDLGIQKRIEAEGGRVDVFGAVIELGLPLLFRPLDGLLGAFVPGKNPGVIITTQRTLPIQRFTGAHELGHFWLKHAGSLDGEEILKRSPWGSVEYDLNELEADAFAAEFLLPRWLFVAHARRQEWNADSMANPIMAYQMALRVGASYKATCLALERHGIIDAATLAQHRKNEPSDLKRVLLKDYPLKEWYPDVWLLTEKDAGAVIEGGPNDLFLVRLKEHTTAGYLWDIEDLKANGFAIVKDDRLVPDTSAVGATVERQVIAQSTEPRSGRLSLREQRPWEPEAAAEFHVGYNMLGKEEGRSRAERRRLEAA